MTRTTSGWLTADSLKAGEREQYAVQRSYGTVTVELLYINDGDRRDRTLDHLPMPWVTTLRIEGPKPKYETWRSFRLSAARKKFSQLVRKHP